MVTPKSYHEVWDTYGVCDVCDKYERMNKQSAEYKKWLSSKEYQKWKDEHETGAAQCNRVLKLDCVGHVQKRIGKALQEYKKKRGKLSDGGGDHRLTDKTIDKL